MKRALVIALLLQLTACVSSKFIPSTTVSYPPFSGIVPILYEKPSEEFEVLGTVVARGEDVTLATVLEELQRKAAEVGGNAVIVQQNSSTTSPMAAPLATGGFIMVSAEIKEVVGTVIRTKR